MFILAYLVVLLVRANHVVVPHTVSFIVGLLAILEASLYVVIFAIAIAGLVLSQKNK